KKYRYVSPETLEMEKELDNLCVFDFDTDVAVRMHNLEADNELLPKYISTLRRLQNNDGKTVTLQDKIEAEKDEKSRGNDRNFTQRIRAIAISVRCAIQELKQAFRQDREPDRADAIQRRIASHKRAERANLEHDGLRPEEQRLREVQSRENELKKQREAEPDGLSL
ncbi:hypothetical protein DC914_RS27585, partial [Vibrio parahaemolyticus]|uniref:hypothetical protein n=1 Tax=Vibrio harveyi group TaxID=717610 RepID=UPI00215F3678